MSLKASFRSPMWQVLASGDGEPFQIHEDILAALSEKARAFTTAATERKLDLRHWDEATVGRFAEYLYSGDYQCPDPVLLATPPASSEWEQKVNWGNKNRLAVVWASLDKARDAQSGVESTPPPPVRPLTPLHKVFHAGPDPLQPLSAAETFRRKRFDPAKHDFEEVFLTHARVYTLARYLEVEPLRTMTLQRLLRTLINIGSVQSNWHLTTNLEDLITYIYKETDNDHEDRIRTVISQFIALNVVLLESRAIKNCIENCRGFGVELVEKVYRRLAVAEQDLGNERKQSADLKLQLGKEQLEPDSLQHQLEKEKAESVQLMVQVGVGRAESADFKLQLEKERVESASLRLQLEEERVRSARLKLQLGKEQGKAPGIVLDFGPAQTAGSFFEVPHESGPFVEVEPESESESESVLEVLEPEPEPEPVTIVEDVESELEPIVEPESEPIPIFEDVKPDLEPTVEPEPEPILIVEDVESGLGPVVGPEPKPIPRSRKLSKKEMLVKKKKRISYSGVD